ncbi:MAG: hypothetical protein WDN02_15165 [Methylovirgula sp.]|uniref:hypothetical protein n=1 Tax=Methylovirgula sp. TaxID=1978224 RepID=UPI0030760FB3
MIGGDFEFFFYIVGVDRKTGKQYTYWSGKETAVFITNIHDRVAILGKVLEGIVELVNLAEPTRVCMFAYDEPLPEKALFKLLDVKETFHKLGFKVEELPKAQGHLGWSMERNT